MERIGQLVSVNVGEPHDVEWFGRTVRTAIWKGPVEGPVAVRGVNLAGDDQADRRVHGGVDKAVYAYAVEDYRWWDLEPATFGENLTTEGIDLGATRVGERWQVGTVVLEVSRPRHPCFKLGIRLGTATFVDRFAEAARPGTYLRILEEGELAAGDGIDRVSRPAAAPTILDVYRSERSG